MNQLRPDLPPLPPRIRALPIDERGYPIPWFVDYLPNGKPEFRAMDRNKRVRAVNEKLCWVCGDKLGKYKAFVVGTMCAVNRTSAEPPSHVECAEFSVKACPFLTKPQMTRREGGDMAGLTEAPGFALERNPGVTLIWVVTDYELFDDGKGDFLIDIGSPLKWSAWREGRPATAAEIRHAIETGTPSRQARRPCVKSRRSTTVWTACWRWPRRPARR